VAALGLMTLGDGRWRRKGGGRAAALQRFLVDYWSSFYKTSHSAERRGMGHPSRRFSVRQEVRIEERSLVGPECGPLSGRQREPKRRAKARTKLAV
jgi:hypothetical protein